MFEDVENNPYLNDFYENMPRWSFNLQIYFLNSRLKQIIDIQSGDTVVIQDRTIYEDAHIFAPNLHEMGLMSNRDFENYINLFRTYFLKIEECKFKNPVRPGDTMIIEMNMLGRERRGINQMEGKIFVGNKLVTSASLMAKVFLKEEGL